MNPSLILRLSLLCSLVMSLSQPLLADRPTFWLTPLGGYRFSSSIPLDDTTFSKLDIADNPVYGFSAGVEVPEGLLELMWTHQDSEIAAIPHTASTGIERLHLNTDQIHFNGLYFPPGFEEQTAQPFAIAGLGVTSYAPGGSTSNISRFSWAIGGGSMIRFTQRLSLRLEAKWNPALASSSGAVFCNSETGRCYVAASGELINQFDFLAGLTIKL